MTHDEWLEKLNGMSDEELDELFCGMTVRLLVYRGRIVRVESCAMN